MECDTLQNNFSLTDHVSGIRKMDCERTENDVKLLDLEAFGLKTDGWQTYLAGTKLEMMKCWRKWNKVMLDVHNFEERAVKLALFASVI